MDKKSPVSMIAKLEHLLWAVSFVWVFYKLYTCGLNYIEWGIILWMGIYLVNSTKETIHDTSDQSSADEHNDIYDNDKKPIVPTLSRYRIFGASNSSFRDNADDGLVCGILLLPMVAASKLMDLMKKNADQGYIVYVQARLELLLLMSAITLILVFVNEYLHPLKKLIRKRGLFVSSIVVSALFTALVTRILPLTDVLSQLSIMMTVLTVTLFQWFLYICVVTLKKCFTLGEMTIVSQSTAILFYGTLEFIYIAFFPENKPGYLNEDESSTSPISVLIHAVIVGIIIIGVMTYPLLRASRTIAQQPYWRTVDRPLSAFRNKKLMAAIGFYVLTVFIVTFMIAPFCKLIIGENPLIWTLDFLYMSPSRVFLCLYWLLMVITTVTIWAIMLDFTSMLEQQNGYNTEKKVLTSSLNKKRKLFHVLAVLLFVPGVIFEPEFLQLAFGVAIALFIFLEYLRYFAVWPWGKNIHVFLTEFIDNRDLGPVILSHIYLLLGCASPVWVGSSNILASLSGILALGFGDSAASLVGKKMGRNYWLDTKKTIEGTIAFVITVMGGALWTIFMTAFFKAENASTIASICTPSSCIKYALVILLTGLIEALSNQNDNIILPLYMYSLTILAQLDT
ncbi:hypothetical protein AB4K20DRAFT_1889309 [Rhizopus microsporus]|uniref:dolichol kinase n=2 Tax=Rhizopus TaxID=4842 RepID=A0A1X0RKC9_RHIZD|nr:hypothetical protein BCV71DRAFT_207560 [Rhizopus microsporus]